MENNAARHRPIALHRTNSYDSCCADDYMAVYSTCGVSLLEIGDENL